VFVGYPPVAATVGVQLLEEGGDEGGVELGASTAASS
jgi:hypothetical protein